VLTAFAGLAECTGYRVDTGTPFYFCHTCECFGLILCRIQSGVNGQRFF
jgi:hypothetical protein